MLFILVLVLCAIKIEGTFEGDACRKNGDAGVCTELRNCLSAKQDIKDRKTPQICGFNKKDPIVCCMDSIQSSPGTVTTEKFVPNPAVNVSAVYQYQYYEYEYGIGDCDPLPSSLTANKTGQKAWDKCIEYQQLVFPCVVNALGLSSRENKCHYGAQELIVDVYAQRYEFSHAALLGYGNDSKNLYWLCGGALISDRYILTAAHCADSKNYGSVTHAALHAVDRANMDPQHQYRIKNVILHPDFKPNRRYHDIALMELEKSVPLNSSTVPACLKTNETVDKTDGSRAIATSWNTNDVLGTKATRLKKINLSQFSMEECSKIYPENRRGGYNDTTQVCYGDRSQVKDICQDDGGNALLEKNKILNCMYSAIGITSYGMGCLSHAPGVYTRVEPYVPWIESVVWP